MLYLFFLLVSISPISPAPVSAGVTVPTSAEPAGAEAADRHVVRAEAAERGSDLIFEDGFESGGTGLWNIDPNIIFSATTNEPTVDFSSCDLPAGVYTFRVTADNAHGGVTYEYIMTVTELVYLCGPNFCKDIEFSDPVIVFD